MPVHIKSHWRERDRPRPLKEVAGALAYIAWRLALDKAITLHGENFVYESDLQRLGVIAEYLAFQTQIADRLAHDSLNEEERRLFVTTLAYRLAEHFQDNAQDLLGSGDHRQTFLDLFNRRSMEYAEFQLTQEGPSYPFLRHLGYEIQLLMGVSEKNRWVIDQVMDRDGGDLYRRFRRALEDLFE